MKLFELLDKANLDVLDHLEREVSVPVVDGLHAQGDVLVLPFDLVSSVVRIGPHVRLADVPPEGVELVRGTAGGNPHTLTADRDSARWTGNVTDPLGLAVAYVENTAPVYLVHPEHGATGIAPGRWLVRRQREHVAVRQRTWFSSGRSGSALVAD